MKNSAKFLYSLPEDCSIVDIETTGLSPDYNSIIEISALNVKNDKVVAEFSSFVKTEEKIPYFITKLTGITDNDVKDAQSKELVLKNFCNFIKTNPIVGHNVKFDLAFINKNLNETLKCTLLNSYTDTLYFSRKIYTNLSSHKLTKIADHLNIDTKRAHRALNDCYTTYYIMQDMKNRIESLRKN